MIHDAAASAIGAIITASAAAVMATIHPYDPADQLWQIVLPLIGAVLTSFGAICLNPQAETRNIVMGRATFGFFGGFCSPSIAISIMPNVTPESWGWIVQVMQWPAALIFMGGFFAWVAYVLSRPFCARAYERADAIALAQVKRLEQLAQGPHNTVLFVDPSKIKTEPPQ